MARYQIKSNMNNYHLSSRQNALLGFFIGVLVSLFVEILFFSGPVEIHSLISTSLGLGFAFFLLSPFK